jgi:HAE1 family hydrophobic/amphiphilic exporter-1
MSEKITSYLGSLSFDKNLASSIQARYISNVRLIILLLLFIVAVGVTSLFVLPRRLNPEIKLTIVQVVTVLPGAGPQDVESLVTTPLEDKLTGLARLDTVTSTSQESLSVIALQFLSNTDKDKAKTDVQNAVNEVTTLPSDAKTPKVTAFDFENQPIWTFAVTTNADKASLMRFSDSLKKKLEDMPHVDTVSLDGFETQEIQIIANEEKIRNLKLNPLQVSQSIKNATQAFPAGQIDNGKFTLSLGINQQATSVADIRNLVLTINNVPLHLTDVADVVIRSKIGQQGVFLANKTRRATPAVNFSVFKTSSADIDKTVVEVESLVKGEIAKTDGQFTLQSVTNAGEEIGKQFTDLIGEFQSTLILVFINLLLFLGLRQALIAMLTIPLTFLLSFAWMNIFGQSINFISLFALLLAFGTSIDDTIVTVSAVTAYNRTKRFTPLETGLLVWRDFIVPIWTTTVTTVWAFLPMILTTGIIGEFIKPIPLVVATTMYSSTFVAWFITLPIMIVLLHPNFPRRIKILIGVIIFLIVTGVLLAISPKNIALIAILPLFVAFLWISYQIRQALSEKFKKSFSLKPIVPFWKRVNDAISHGVIHTDYIGEKYRQLILNILGSKTNRRVVLVCLFSFMLAAYLLIPLGLVKNEFFPKSNVDFLSVSLEMPAGTDNQVVTTETKTILNSLRATPETQAVLGEVGKAPSGGFGGGQSGGHIASFTLVLDPKETRKTDSGTIAQNLRRQFASYNKGKISVIEASGGPPAGADVQIKLIGTDLTTLDKLADETVGYLKSLPGTPKATKNYLFTKKPKPSTAKFWISFRYFRKPKLLLIWPTKFPVPCARQKKIWWKAGSGRQPKNILIF